MPCVLPRILMTSRWQRKALADDFYRKEYGEQGRKMLRLFGRKEPYREEAPGKP